MNLYLPRVFVVKKHYRNTEATEPHGGHGVLLNSVNLHSLHVSVVKKKRHRSADKPMPLK